MNSATWRNYLAPPEVNALYGKVFARFMDPERRLFPGFVAVALAIVGLVPRKRKHPSTSAPRHPENQRAVPLAYALGLLLAFDVSLGFNGVIYRGLYDYFLPFKALRIPARMGIDGRLFAGGAGRLRRHAGSRTGCHRRTARRAVLTLIGLLDARRVRVTPARVVGGAAAAAAGLRRSGARHRRRSNLGDLRVSDRQHGGSRVLCTTRRSTGSTW